MTGTVKIQVWSDYVCPFCMLAEGPLARATEGLDVEIERMPFELRPEPQPTLRPEDDYLPAIWKRAVYPMADRLGVEITMPSVSPQPYTRLAFEGYQYAVEHGKADAYSQRMFRAFFQEDRDLGEIDVLTALAGEIGLATGDFRAALIDGTYADKHREQLRYAAAHQIRAVPTILIGDARLEGVPADAQIRKAVLDAAAEQGPPFGAACSVDHGTC